MDSVVHDRLRAVTSRQNALVKQMRRSFSQGEIVEGCCAIEGLRLIEEAIRSGLKIRAVFFSKSGEIKAERLLNQIGRHAETLLLPDDVFRSAVETEHPQGVAALVKAPAFSTDALVARPDALIVIAAGIQDPGNLGTIVRSAEAFGAGVVLAEKTVALWNSKVVRSSAGSVFRVPAIRMGTAEVFQLCAR